MASSEQRGDRWVWGLCVKHGVGECLTETEVALTRAMSEPRNAFRAHVQIITGVLNGMLKLSLG